MSARRVSQLRTLGRVSVFLALLNSWLPTFAQIQSSSPMGSLPIAYGRVWSLDEAQGKESTPRTRVQTLDDLFAEVARRVPAFGGMFITGKTLNVYLLDTSPQMGVAARRAIAEVFGPGRVRGVELRVLKGQYGFSELKSLHDRVRSLLSIPGVVVSVIEETRNRLKIGLERMEVQPDVESQLLKLHIPREAVIFEKTKPITFLQQRLIGGIEIDRVGAICTLGFIAVRAGTRGFVTCSHCTAVQGGVEGTTFVTPSAPAKTVGVETADPVYFTGDPCPTGRRCRYSDSAFVTISPGITGQRGAIDKPAEFTPYSIQDISKYELFVPAFAFWGEQLVKVGRTTHQTQGQLISTCEDTNPNNPNGTDSGITMLCQDRVEAVSAGGDSGSPVFSIMDPPYGVALAGILWGGNGSEFSFSPILSIEGELGFLDPIWANDPPTIKITQPSDGTKIAYGGFNAQIFDAIAFDFEDGTIQANWGSDKDGSMGTGNQIEFTFANAGERTITATATDQQGATSKDQIKVTAVNSPPQMYIVKPTPGQTLYKGFTYVAEGQSFDSQQFSPLPCNSLKWTSNKLLDSVYGGTFPKLGCAPQLIFLSNGWRMLTLTGIDAEGASGTAKVAVNVVDAPLNSPPVATILSPTDGALLDPYAVAMLTGTAKDPNGKSPISFKWVILNGATLATLGSGTINNGQQTSMTWKPSNNGALCGSATIYLYATNADGSTGPPASATVTLFNSSCVK